MMTLRNRLERLLRFALLAFVLAATMFLSAITTIRVAIRGRVVTMPDVVGKPVNEAEAILQGAGLQLRVADRLYSSLPPDAVIRQSPSAGQEVKLSQTAHVAVSLGAQTVNVPLVEGRSLRATRITLLESGLELGQVSTAFLSSMAPDTVVLQHPSQGALAESPRVDVLVSAGERPDYFVMPSLEGMDQTRGERILSAAGLRLARVNYVAQSGSTPGAIIGQMPARGSRMSPDTGVEISVAR
jgi:serine/threonine-protein kinase